MLVSELDLVDGEKIIRNGDFDVLGFLDDDNGKHLLSYLGNKAFLKQLSNPSIKGIICPPELINEIPPHIDGIIASNYPDRTFWRIHKHVFEKQLDKKPTRIGKNCTVSPLACIADYNVVIGDNVVIDEYTSINANTIIGNDVYIHSHCVIGAELEQRAVEMNGSGIIGRHYGGVIIGDGAFIESQALIARGLFWGTNTYIGQKTVVGAAAFIAHACMIGDGVLIEGKTHIAGSTHIDNNVEIGAFSFVGNKLYIGQNAVVAAGSRLVHSISENMAYWNEELYEKRKFEAIRRMVALNRSVERHK